jgi:hypothetical protein
MFKFVIKLLLLVVLIVSFAGSPWKSLRTTDAGPPLVGDLNVDNVVDFKDIQIFARQ